MSGAESAGEGGQDQCARVGLAQPRSRDVIDGVANQDTVEATPVGSRRRRPWQIAGAGCAGVWGGGVERGVEGGAVGEDEVAVSDFAARSLVANGNDPTTVVVPGLDGEPYPAVTWPENAR